MGIGGIKKYIESPEQLWQFFIDYVEHERLNPMRKTEYIGQHAIRVEIELETPITFEGFECYLFKMHIISDLGDYSSNKGDRYSEFATIIKQIKSFCFTNNFKGASVGLFNASLIARKLGLTEKSEVKLDATIQDTSIKWGDNEIKI